MVAKTRKLLNPSFRLVCALHWETFAGSKGPPGGGFCVGSNFLARPRVIYIRGWYEEDILTGLVGIVLVALVAWSFISRHLMWVASPGLGSVKGVCGDDSIDEYNKATQYERRAGPGSTPTLDEQAMKRLAQKSEDTSKIRGRPYLWALQYSRRAGRVPTVMTKEVPPRF